MECTWRKPKDTTKFPPAGQYVYCYVCGEKPFLVPSVGFSTGYGIVDLMTQRKVAFWLDGESPPPSIPSDEFGYEA